MFKSRRQFLKTGLALTSGLTLCRSVHAQGSEEIKIGLIGCGSRGAGAVAEALSVDPAVKLVAMADLFETPLQNRLRSLQQRFSDQIRCPDDARFVGFDGYRGIIEQSDIILIACASKFHPMYTEAAIQAGKHVFVEKPHAIDPAGIKRLAAAAKLAESKKLSLMTGFQSRFLVPLQETMKRIHDGAIGDIVSMESRHLHGSLGLRTRNPSQNLMQSQLANWHCFTWLSGDELSQTLIHNIDRMSWAMQEILPDQAWGTGGRNVFRPYNSLDDFDVSSEKSPADRFYGDSFDHGSIVFEYLGDVRYYASFRAVNSCYGNTGDTILGTKGSCRLPGCRIFDRSGKTVWQYRGPSNSPTLAEQAELIQSVKTGSPINRGASVCKSSLIGCMGLLAMYQGDLVELETVQNADFDFGGLAPDKVGFNTPPPTRPDVAGNYPIPLPGTTRFL